MDLIAGIVFAVELVISFNTAFVVNHSMRRRIIVSR